MANLGEIEPLIMVGYGDRLRTNQEACDVFNDKYLDKQIYRSTVTRLMARYDETLAV